MLSVFGNMESYIWLLSKNQNHSCLQFKTSFDSRLVILNEPFYSVFGLCCNVFHLTLVASHPRTQLVMKWSQAKQLCGLIMGVSVSVMKYYCKP